MQVSVTYKNTEGESWLNDYVEERLKKLEKYIDNPAEAHVVLSVEKFRNVAEVNLVAGGMTINGSEEARDMHIAVDNVIEKIERQIKKHKGKIRDHKTAGASGNENIGSVESPLEDYEDMEHPKVVETRTIILKPMFLEEAVMEMDALRNRFIVYRDSLSEKVCVIYSREDGNYALLEVNG